MAICVRVYIFLATRVVGQNGEPCHDMPRHAHELHAGLMPVFRKWLGQDVRSLLLSRTPPQDDFTGLYHLANEVPTNVNVLGPAMEASILSKGNSRLVIHKHGYTSKSILSHFSEQPLQPHRL